MFNFFTNMVEKNAIINTKAMERIKKLTTVD